MSEPDRTSWGARLLAPLAFFTAATILVLLVHSSLNPGSDADSPAATERAAGSDNRPRQGQGSGTQAGSQNQPQRQRRFYRVREGDTLGGIAAEFDTTVDDLVALNPGIDPTGLTPGQRVRVR